MVNVEQNWWRLLKYTGFAVYGALKYSLGVLYLMHSVRQNILANILLASVK